MISYRMVANELTFAVLALVVLLAIAFFAVYRKTGTVTVGAIDLYLCLHNLKYIILLWLSPSFLLLSILSDTPPNYLVRLLIKAAVSSVSYYRTRSRTNTLSRAVIV
jgi:hypothetical protein